ncbi:MAG TPA: hypothetical protein DCL77_01155 [Prolixibacteraceae bacterium]|jgi:hypothetical protein|nr:hypothetical protein [Prolixibacteraceae bacterium]
MKNILLIACILFSFLSLSTFGQKISETNFALGISKIVAPDYDHHWEEDPPTYFLLNASKSWYNDHGLTLMKEAGLNLQYAKIHNLTTGLGAGNEYTGNITSLFADVAMLARFRINKTFAFGVGPEAEILLIGQNNLNIAYYTHFTNPPSSGEKRDKGLNRDYFDQPSFGIKVSLFESMVDARTSIGLNFSYLWTKSELSNFYASNYTRISFVIGFKKQKEEVIPETLPKF